MSVDIARINRDRPARVLQQARRAESHDAAANDRDFARGSVGDLVQRKGRRSPAQTQASSAVAVIVDYDLVTIMFSLNTKSIGTVGAMTNDDPNHCIHRYMRCSPRSV